MGDQNIFFSSPHQNPVAHNFHMPISIHRNFLHSREKIGSHRISRVWTDLTEIGRKWRHCKTSTKIRHYFLFFMQKVYFLARTDSKSENSHGAQLKWIDQSEAGIWWEITAAWQYTKQVWRTLRWAHGCNMEAIWWSVEEIMVRNSPGGWTHRLMHKQTNGWLESEMSSSLGYFLCE